jgi:hypothetical protein
MRRQLSLALILALAACGAGAVAGWQNLQRPADAPPPTGLLMGVVVDPLDGQAVANAQVMLGGASSTVRTTNVLTDADGRFVFMDLPRGTYTITAAKPGYAEGALGRRRPLGLPQPLALAEAERIGDLKIPIWKHAAITGRIVDEAGEPMVGIAVRVLQRTIVAGKRKLTPGATARTDDRGVYRIGSLTPGDYVVAVGSTQAAAPQSIVDSYTRLRMTPAASDFLREVSFSGADGALMLFERHPGARVGTQAFLSTGGGVRAGTPPMPSADGRIYVYPTKYHPAASTAAEAAVLTVRSGEERTGVDLQLQLTATSRVSGTVTGPDGPMMGALSLVSDSDDLSTDIGFETATTLSDATGRFTFLGVPEGRHHLRASWAQGPGTGGARGGPPPPRPQALAGFTLWAARPITVGATDIRDLAITASRGFRISGRTEFVGNAAQPEPDAVRRMTATIDPADGRPFVTATIGRGQFDEEGRLSTYQIPPGRHYLRINNPPPGWTLKHATVDGRDISNVPLTLDRDVTGVVITFTDRPASLSGQVSGAAGAPDSSAAVLVFPKDPAAWTDYGLFPRRLLAVRADREGRYLVERLPPGDYMVVAVADESTADWQDPVVLRALSRLATTVTIGDGEARSLPLKTTPSGSPQPEAPGGWAPGAVKNVGPREQ